MAKNVLKQSLCSPVHERIIIAYVTRRVTKRSYDLNIAVVYDLRRLNTTRLVQVQRTFV